MTNNFEKGFQPAGNELEEAAVEASSKFLELVTPEMPGKAAQQDNVGAKAEKIELSKGGGLSPRHIFDVDTVLGDRVRDPKEIGEFFKPEKSQKELSQTERLIANALSGSVDRADMRGIQDALKAVMENPSSRERVMEEVKKRLENSMPGVQVGWESGTTNNQEPFLRLNISAIGSKSGPFTDLTIGSDGRVSATHTPFMQYDRPPRHLSGEKALRMLKTNPFEGMPSNDMTVKPLQEQLEEQGYIPRAPMRHRP